MLKALFFGRLALRNTHGQQGGEVFRRLGADLGEIRNKAHILNRLAVCFDAVGDGVGFDLGIGQRYRYLVAHAVERLQAFDRFAKTSP